MAKKKATRKTQRRARGGRHTGDSHLPEVPVEMMEGGLTISVPGKETITIIFGEGPQ